MKDCGGPSEVWLNLTHKQPLQMMATSINHLDGGAVGALSCRVVRLELPVTSSASFLGDLRG